MAKIKTHNIFKMLIDDFNISLEEIAHRTNLSEHSINRYKNKDDEEIEEKTLTILKLLYEILKLEKERLRNSNRDIASFNNSNTNVSIGSFSNSKNISIGGSMDSAVGFESGNLIKSVCNKLGITYKELAEKIGYKPDTINKIASTGQISENVKKAIEMYLEIINLKQSMQDYENLKDILKKAILQ